jgi:hypothetical protein
MGLESAPNSLVHREAMNADVSCNKMRRCLLDVMIYVWLLAEELDLSHASDGLATLFAPSFES